MVFRHFPRDFGPRFAGTEGETKALEVILQKMEALGLEVEFQEIRYLGWRRTGRRALEVLVPEPISLPFLPLIWSGSTPPDGIEGRLVPAGKAILNQLHHWSKYDLLSSSGDLVAWVFGRPGGVPIPVTVNDARLTLPQIVLGGADNERLQQWLREGSEVRVRLTSPTQFMPGGRAHNIIGTLPGRTNPFQEIIVGSHYDTVYDCPGEVDNASGVEVMLRAAEALVSHRPRKTFRFVSFALEEWWQLGSYSYVEKAQQLGTLPRIQAVLNLDQVGDGNNCELWCSESILPVLREASGEAGSVDRFKVTFVLPHLPQVDSYPFHVAGVPAATIIWFPYSPAPPDPLAPGEGEDWVNKAFSWYHLPSDTSKQVKGPVVDETFRLAEAILLKLDSLPDGALA